MTFFLHSFTCVSSCLPPRGSPYHHHHHHADDEINWFNVLFKIGLCFLVIAAIVLSIITLVLAVQEKDDDNDLHKAAECEAA